MPDLALVRMLFTELIARKGMPRTPEPSLVMDDPDQVDSFVQAGRETGVMAPTYLFNCANICDVIRPGDRVLDLACGPANQLALVARLNPQSSFVGVDLSESMLQQATDLVQASRLENVSFQLGDITNLSAFDDASFEAVICTLSLHHLPDLDCLGRTFAEITRVLKPGGGLYLVDFARLKSESSIRFFAYQHEQRQPRLFTQDYYNSLRAAFSLGDFRQLGARLPGRVRLYSMALVPFLMAFKSEARRGEDHAARVRLRELADGLPPLQKSDLSAMRGFFRLGGLSSPLLD